MFNRIDDINLFVEVNNKIKSIKKDFSNKIIELLKKDIEIDYQYIKQLDNCIQIYFDIDININININYINKCFEVSLEFTEKKFKFKPSYWRYNQLSYNELVYCIKQYKVLSNILLESKEKISLLDNEFEKLKNFDYDTGYFDVLDIKKIK